MSGGSEVAMTSAATTATNPITNSHNNNHNINMEPPPPPFTLTSPTSHSHSLSHSQQQQQQQHVIQTMRFGGAYSHSPSEGMIVNSMGLKKKRGRPRKYGPDGSMALTLSGAPPNPPVTLTTQTPNVGPLPHQPPPLPPQAQQPGGGGGGFLASGPPPPSTVVAPGGADVIVSATPVSTSMKKRGRPPGSGKKHLLLEAMGSAGFGFTPHVITVKTGEDVSSKIMSFSQNGPRAVCILSANGSISNVTLRQPATSGGTVTYEGRFEILSLSGSYLPSDDGGQRSRTGGLSVSLSGPDGRVLGGSVAGLLVAAAPVQVVVGSFIADGRKESKPVTLADPLSAMMRLTSPGSTGGGSPQSRGTLSESSGGPGSPLNQISSACNNSNPQSLSGISWK